MKSKVTRKIHTFPFQQSHCTIADTNAIAESFTKFILAKKHFVPILLSGVIGAGKSVFARFCLQTLGLLNEQQSFTSPSFSIINEYVVQDDKRAMYPLPIYHIDLYRITTKQEVDNLGVFDLIQSCISFIEWPERIDYGFPRPFYICRIEIDTEHMRNILISYCE